MSRDWNRDNGEGIRLALAKKAAKIERGPSVSWWIGKSREDFQAEVKRRHACILNSRNASDRSLGKVV